MKSGNSSIRYDCGGGQTQASSHATESTVPKPQAVETWSGLYPRVRLLVLVLEVGPRAGAMPVSRCSVPELSGSSPASYRNVPSTPQQALKKYFPGLLK